MSQSSASTRRCRLSALWLCALLAAAILAVNPEIWHEDATEQHCAVCHISHQPLLPSTAAAYVDRPTAITWHSAFEELPFNTHAPLVTTSGRAPPA